MGDLQGLNHNLPYWYYLKSVNETMCMDHGCGACKRGWKRDADFYWENGYEIMVII